MRVVAGVGVFDVSCLLVADAERFVPLAVVTGSWLNTRGPIDACGALNKRTPFPPTPPPFPPPTPPLPPPGVPCDLPAAECEEDGIPGGRWFMMSFSRWRGRAGAWGCWGAGAGGR